jgi:hypothetical protein
MIFDETTRKLLLTGSDRISAMVNDTPVGPKLNGLFLMTLTKNPENYRRPEVIYLGNVNDRHVGPKPTWSGLDNFRS